MAGTGCRQGTCKLDEAAVTHAAVTEETLWAHRSAGTRVFGRLDAEVCLAHQSDASQPKAGAICRRAHATSAAVQYPVHRRARLRLPCTPARRRRASVYVSGLLDRREHAGELRLGYNRAAVVASTVTAFICLPL